MRFERDRLLQVPIRLLQVPIRLLNAGRLLQSSSVVRWSVENVCTELRTNDMTLWNQNLADFYIVLSLISMLKVRGHAN